MVPQIQLCLLVAVGVSSLENNSKYSDVGLDEELRALDYEQVNVVSST